MRSDRYEKKKKKGKWKSVLLILLLLIAGTLGYSYFQFKQGVSQTEGEANIQTEEFEFNGEKDKYGGTNILILGSDARGEEKSRADTIMVAQYHPEKGTYKLISFMRDMYVDIPGHGQNRINSALAYGGPELLRQTLKENFDIDIKYYSIIDFEGFVHLIDEAFPRGVEIDVEKRMSANIGVTLEPGLQRLDGEHLLGYVRFRQDAVGDFGRVERQQKVMKEVASQFTSLQTITKLPKLIGVVTPFVNTNMNTGDILYIGKDFLSKDNRDVETLRVPVDGTFENERINGAEVLGIDKEANKAAIHEFLSK
ncbi:LCP family protein [Cytobacillus firmus]|uniref:LCP family protein n=1 Tax=Cytobacillus firmus TaxID=1399 RepID=UPI000ADDC375|nr:LCP family protein [Cytobacillus firmus]MEC1891824.1 LCP family protein [Cytobacillus firmus]MED4448123.1 LCP family protein [Cytobacillus firmus]MED4768474.1 LCP family protein [Cytobacillus firmus]SUV02547.1 regulatory protein MsrR [Cytobacillus firmus]